MAAGAAEVKMSEGETLALVRVMDGEVPAAVVTLASPEEAKMWIGRNSRLQKSFESRSRLRQRTRDADSLVPGLANCLTPRCQHVEIG